ncbi:MAG: glycosyltransferase, partial [Pseudomonadota bacterium]
VPFGRHDLLFELEPWMRHIRASAPGTLIVSSLRDLIGKTVLAEQTDLIARLANRYFDAALVHADPAFLRFEECFPEAGRIRCPVLHTGFVAQPAETQPVASERPFILVSIGGGRIGGEVLETAVEAARLLADELPHEFRLFTGPFLTDAAFAALEARAAGLPNVRIARFTSRLMGQMQAAALSISLAGYNTTMNVLRAGTPAILVPIGHYDFDCEQLMRAEKLAALGAVDMLRTEALGPAVLAERIRAGLMRGRSASPFNLDGARTATETLAGLLAGRAAPRALQEA